jgi:chaperonin GroEL
MAKKMINFGTDARKSIQTGVNTVVKAVKTSYGPVGRNSIIEKSYGAPDITNDGVTIAKAVELEGLEQLGVSLMQQAANKTNEEAGDGTSSTTIVAGSLINEGIKVVEAGSDPVKVRVGIQKAVKFSLDYLNKNAKPIKTKEEMADVGAISSRSREVGDMIAEMLEKVGKDGVVTVQTGDSSKIEQEVTEGMRFDKGYKSPYLVTDAEKMEALAEKPYILVTDQKISSIQDVLPVIEELAQKGKKDLVVIADDIEGEALATFVLNKIRGVFNVFPVQAPAFGDRRKAMLEDIAVLTGSTFLNSDLGQSPKTAKIEDLGSAEKVIMDKDNTTIIGGKGDKSAIQNRAEIIRKGIEETSSDYDKEKLGERLAKLVGGVGVIKVGAATEVEMKELKYVVEDALNATKAAALEGVVPGGASTLIRISKELENLKVENEEEKTGVNIVKKALEAPFRAIAENSGIYDISILVNEIRQSATAGYDFKESKMVDDMLKAGIIDPVLVLKQSISNASSIASSVITTEVVLADEPKAEEPAPAGGMPGMGMGGMPGMM